MALEDWIAANVFRNDSSRVFLASDDYVFRRRFELTDMSINFNDLDIASLNFPFANYWPLNTGWKGADRLAANPAALVYEGIYEGDTKIKAAASVLEIPVTFYFDREDDARLAYEILYFKTFNEHYYSIDMPYSTSTLGLPVNIKIEGLTFNPSYNENNWLKENRIFTVKATFNVRSYSILPPVQPDNNLTLDVNGYLSDGTIYNDGIERYYITEEVWMNLMNYNDLITSSIMVNGQVADNNIKINKLVVSEVSTNSAKISWEVPEGEKISRITLNIAMKANSIEVSPEKNYYILDGLSAGGFYTGFITFYNENKASKKLSFTVSTLLSQSQLEMKKSPTNTLVGLSW